MTGVLVIVSAMPCTLPLAEVEAHLSELIERVVAQRERVTVTVHGRPSIVLLAMEDLEALEDTVAVLLDADTVGQLAASDRELAHGQAETEEQLMEAMKRRVASD